VFFFLEKKEPKIQEKTIPAAQATCHRVFSRPTRGFKKGVFDFICNIFHFCSNITPINHKETNFIKGRNLWIFILFVNKCGSGIGGFFLERPNKSEKFLHHCLMPR